MYDRALLHVAGVPVAHSCRGQTTASQAHAYCRRRSCTAVAQRLGVARAAAIEMAGAISRQERVLPCAVILKSNTASGLLLGGAGRARAGGVRNPRYELNDEEVACCSLSPGQGARRHLPAVSARPARSRRKTRAPRARLLRQEQLSPPAGTAATPAPGAASPAAGLAADPTVVPHPRAHTGARCVALGYRPRRRHAPRSATKSLSRALGPKRLLSRASLRRTDPRVVVGGWLNER